MKAGRQCGDLVHPLVYCPELHFSEFTSAVADMKNSVAVGVEQGGAGSERPREAAAGQGRVPPTRPQIRAPVGGGEKSSQVGTRRSLVSLPACPLGGRRGVLPTPGSASVAPISSFAGAPLAWREGRPRSPRAWPSGSLSAAPRVVAEDGGVERVRSIQRGPSWTQP